MENQQLDVFRGDYGNFEAVKEERRARQERLHEAQMEKREHLQEYITKHGQLGSNGPSAAAQRKSRQKKMERINMEVASKIEGRKLQVSYDGTQQEEVTAVEEKKLMKLNFPDPGVGPKQDASVLTLDGVTFGYEGKPSLLEDVTFQIGLASRCALLGRNGCGKSTLLHLLLNDLAPQQGRAVRDPKCRVEYIAQHSLDQLDPKSTVLGLALESYPGDSSDAHEASMRRHLAQFGLAGDLPKQRIGTLSGGQKCRVALSLVMYRAPHILIMDEPTNHLDLETIDAVITAMKDFRGGLLVVSHDRHMISQVCDELLVVGNKRVKRFNGDMREYTKKVLKEAKQN
jgi:ATPase subunit of ABC transporter with duplicated ATPase domains